MDPSADIASIHEMFCWCKRRLVHLLLNLVRHCFLGSGSRGGGDRGDEVRQGLLTGFGEMDLLPGPHGRALFAPMGIGIVRRVNDQRSGRKISGLSPSQVPVIFKEGVLDPEPMQDDNGRNPPPPVEISCLVTSGAR